VRPARSRKERYARELFQCSRISTRCLLNLLVFPFIAASTLNNIENSDVVGLGLRFERPLINSLFRTNLHLKCDRNQPCRKCKEGKKSCVYNPLRDGRRKGNRTLDQLKRRSEILDKLLAILRSPSKSEVQQLMDLIEGGASLEEIDIFLDDSSGEVANETQAAKEGEGVVMRRMISISELLR